MDSFDKILFTKVNLVNALGLVSVATVDAFEYFSQKATLLTPIVTVCVGCTVLLYNVIKTYKEIFNKNDDDANGTR